MPIIKVGRQKQVFTDSISSEELMSIVMGTFRLQMYKWRISEFEFDIITQGNNTIHSLLTLITKKS